MAESVDSESSSDGDSVSSMDKPCIDLQPVYGGNNLQYCCSAHNNNSGTVPLWCITNANISQDALQFPRLDELYHEIFQDGSQLIWVPYVPTTAIVMPLGSGSLTTTTVSNSVDSSGTVSYSRNSSYVGWSCYLPLLLWPNMQGIGNSEQAPPVPTADEATGFTPSVPQQHENITTAQQENAAFVELQRNVAMAAGERSFMHGEAHGNNEQEQECNCCLFVVYSDNLLNNNAAFTNQFSSSIEDPDMNSCLFNKWLMEVNENWYRVFVPYDMFVYVALACLHEMLRNPDELSLQAIVNVSEDYRVPLYMFIEVRAMWPVRPTTRTVKLCMVVSGGTYGRVDGIHVDMEVATCSPNAAGPVGDASRPAAAPRNGGRWQRGPEMGGCRGMGGSHGEAAGWHAGAGRGAVRKEGCVTRPCTCGVAAAGAPGTAQVAHDQAAESEARWWPPGRGREHPFYMAARATGSGSAVSPAEGPSRRGRLFFTVARCRQPLASAEVIHADVNPVNALQLLLPLRQVSSSKRSCHTCGRRCADVIHTEQGDLLMQGPPPCTDYAGRFQQLWLNNAGNRPKRSFDLSRDSRSAGYSHLVSQAGQIPIGQRSVGQMPTGQVPAGQIPIGQRSVGQIPTGQVPAGQMFAGQMPAGQIPCGPGASANVSGASLLPVAPGLASYTNTSANNCYVSSCPSTSSRFSVPSTYASVSVSHSLVPVRHFLPAKNASVSENIPDISESRVNVPMNDTTFPVSHSAVPYNSNAVPSNNRNFQASHLGFRNNNRDVSVNRPGFRSNYRGFPINNSACRGNNRCFPVDDHVQPRSNRSRKNASDRRRRRNVRNFPHFPENENAENFKIQRRPHDRYTHDRLNPTQSLQINVTDQSQMIRERYQLYQGDKNNLQRVNSDGSNAGYSNNVTMSPDIRNDHLNSKMHNPDPKYQNSDSKTDNTDFKTTDSDSKKDASDAKMQNFDTKKEKANPRKENPGNKKNTTDKKHQANNKKYNPNYKKDNHNYKRDHQNFKRDANKK